MLKKDKNGFIEIIKEQGFDPSAFKRYEKEDVEGHPGFIVQLSNSPLFFLARTYKDNYYQHDTRFIEFAPNFPKSEYSPSDHWCEIDEVYNDFEFWLTRHVKQYLEEIDIPDLWSQLEGKDLFDIDPLRNRGTDSFSKTEKERIVTSIQHFRRLLEVEYSPTHAQIEMVDDRLDYLTKSLDRLTKVDWQGIAISTVISISIAMNLDTDSGKTLFELFKKSFAAALEYFP